MNFRKLLAFVLVFSLATHPDGVRFSYAEGTKTAEVKIEEKTEASGELVIDEAELDEYLFDPDSREQKIEEAATEKTAKTSKISGALAGAIAAGVAAVTAAVGTAGLMVYNGVSNKDEIAQLWKSEEGSFFSRLSKTISILFKGANKVPGEQIEAPVVEETTEVPVEEQTSVVEGQTEAQVEEQSPAVEGQTEAQVEEKTPVAEETTEAQVEEQSLAVEGQTEVPVEETTPVAEETTEAPVEETTPVAEETTETPAEETTPVAEEKTEAPVEEQSPAVEEKTEVQIEEQSPAVEGQTAAQVEEQSPAVEEKTEAPVEEQSPAVEGQTEAPVEETTPVAEDTTETPSEETTPVAEEKTETQVEEQSPAVEEKTEANEGSNSREENPITISVEEKKEPFVGPLPKKVYDLIAKKNSASNTLNKLKDTCGLDTVGFKRELSAIDLWTLTTPGELAEAESNLNSIINRIKGLRGKCSDIKSKKDYIEKKWPTAYKVLDKSDFNLNMAWNALKNKPVTEGDLGKLSEEYKNIADRVKAIINSNNKISKLTSKISKAIEDKKDAADFGVTHYSGELKAIDKMERREDSLGQIIGKLDLLYDNLQKNYSKKDIKAVNKALDEFDNSELVKYFESEECSANDKEDRYEPYEELVKALIAKKNEIIDEAKKNHSLNGVVEKLEELLSIKRKVLSIEGNTKEVKAVIKHYENEAWFDKAHFEEWLNGATKDKIATKADLDLRKNNVAAILNDLKTNFSKKEIEAVNKALAEIDNSAIVKGTCTQSSWGGLKKENKLTPEQCNTLKDKFVAERDRLVEEAKSNHSVVGLAEKLNDLNGKTDEYINDVAKLEAGVSKIGKILGEKQSFDLLDTSFIKAKVENLEMYSLNTLKDNNIDIDVILNSLSTYTNENRIQIRAKQDELENTSLTKYNQFKALREELASKENDIIVEIKQGCGLDVGLDKLNELLKQHGTVASQVADLLRKSNSVRDILDVRKRITGRDESKLEREYSRLNTVPANVKALTKKLEDFGNLLVDLDAEHWGKLVEYDKIIKSVIAYAGDNAKFIYEETLDELSRNLVKGKITLDAVVKELEDYSKAPRIG